MVIDNQYMILALLKPLHGNIFSGEILYGVIRRY